MSSLNVTFPDDVLAIGTEVYIPRPLSNEVHEDEIMGYECILQQRHDELLLMPTSYLLGIPNNDNPTSGWKRDQFCLTRDEAISKCKIYRVSGISPEEWVHAIGLSVGVNSDFDSALLQFNDRCELADCCEVTTNIRSILYDLATSGRMQALTRDSLCELLMLHEPPNTKPVLDRILTQLDLTWNIHDETSTDKPTKN